MDGIGSRRALLRLGVAAAAMLAGAAPGMSGQLDAVAHHHRKRRRQRCRQHCASNQKTCDRGCDILDGDSQSFCKQGCQVALAQCRSYC